MWQIFEFFQNSQKFANIQWLSIYAHKVFRSMCYYECKLIGVIESHTKF